MERLSSQQPAVESSGKSPLIAIISVIVIVLALAGLTKAGMIPNYLGIDLLCSENLKPTNTQINPITGDPTMDFKPVIYLYPQQDQQTSVKINYSGNLSVTYPKYSNGWNVTAYPDGKIINSKDGKEYSYLFWEGIDNNAKYDLSSGFIVKGSEAAEFLQSSLSTLGLTAKEYNEFIVFWLPKMIDNEYNLIHFATKDEYNDKTVLEISPQPDSILRVFMVLKKLDKNENIIPQELKPFKREGFSVVEWGGTELK